MFTAQAFLFQVGRDIDAFEVYRKVYMWNHTEKGAAYEVRAAGLNQGLVKGDDSWGGCLQEKICLGCHWCEEHQYKSTPILQ